MPHGPSINANTSSLGQLDAFLKQNADPGAKILGKRDSQTGEITLYVSNKPSSLWDRISGKAAERRSAGREALNDIFGRFEKTVTTKSEDEATGVRQLFRNINTRVSERDSHAVRAGAVRWLTKAATSEKTAQDAKLGPPPSGPNLSKFAPNALDTAKLAGDLSTGISGNSDQKALAKNLGDSIVQAFKSGNPSKTQLEEFALSSGEELKSDLMTAFKSTLSDAEFKALESSPNTAKVLDEAFNHAASQMLSNGVLDKPLVTVTIEGQSRDMPWIKIDGIEYEPIVGLGIGGFAEVFEYKDRDGNKIAFKLAKNGEAGSLDEAKAEIKAHAGAVGDGNENVLDMKGVLRLPDGRVGIALEIAPHGNVFDMGKSIKSYLDQGLITPQQADVLRLTMLMDMAEGLRHIQEVQDMTHLDFKPPNCLIGSDGKVKIADFGLTLEGSEIKYGDIGSLDNPSWQAPELLYAKRDIGEITNLSLKPVVRVAQRTIEGLTDAFPKASEKEIKTLAQGILRPITEDLKDQQKVTNQVDTWALGISAINLFTGDHFLPGLTFMSKIEDAIKKFGANPQSIALGRRDEERKLPDGTFAEETAFASVNSLINSLLNPDPNLRPSFTDVLKNSAFTYPGVGSTDARNLLLAIASKDQGKIDTAKTTLDRTLVPPLPPVPPQVSTPTQGGLTGVTV